MSEEQLDKGETGDAIWDAAQYQLALTGCSCMPLPMLTALFPCPSRPLNPLCPPLRTPLRLVLSTSWLSQVALACPVPFLVRQVSSYFLLPALKSTRPPTSCWQPCLLRHA